MNLPLLEKRLVSCVSGSVLYWVWLTLFCVVLSSMLFWVWLTRVLCWVELLGEQRQCVARATVTKCHRPEGFNNRNSLSQFLEAGAPRWRRRQDFLGPGGTICSCLSPSFSWFAGNTSCSWLVVTVLSTFVLTLCVQVCVQMSPCCKDTGHNVLGAHSALVWHLDWLYLHRLYFQIRSHSECLRVRASVDEFWGTQIAAEEVSPRLRLGNLSSTFRL